MIEQAFKDLQANQKPAEEAKVNDVFKQLMMSLAKGRRLFELINEGLSKRQQEEQGSVNLGKRQRTEE